MASRSRTLETFKNLQVFLRCRERHLQKASYATVGDDKPVTYSLTQASKMKTEDTFHIRKNPAVFRGERYILVASVFTLLVYGVFLREENKIDRILSGSFDYPEEDEMKVLNMLLQAKLKGLKTEELERKLAEIRKRKNK